MSEKTYTQIEVDIIHKTWSKALTNAKVKLRKYFHDKTIPDAIAACDKWWVAWGKSECPHWAENKGMCVYCWQERQKSLGES